MSYCIGMKVGVCGISCKICPRMIKGICPNGPGGCSPRENPMCQISSCAARRGVTHCFFCPDFPCETTKTGPISYGYCHYISGSDGGGD